MNSLDYGLLVPREPIRLKTARGLVEKLDQSILSVPPLIITKDEAYDFDGLRSGGRGGLVNIDGINLRIKGCGLVSLFIHNGKYFESMHAGRTFEPYRAQYLSSAEDELKWLRIYNKAMKRQGFPTPCEPVAIIDYGIEFEPADLSAYVVIKFAKVFPGRFKFDGKLGASVMKVSGDTRLPEIYRQDILTHEAALVVAYRFGLMAGSQKGLTDEVFFWDLGNAHAGNYLVFKEGENIYLAMTDFDEAFRASAFHNQIARVNPIIFPFPPFFGTQKSKEKRHLLSSVYDQTSPNLRREFQRGFKDGYANPDKRELLPLELLCQAYDLKSAKPVTV